MSPGGTVVLEQGSQVEARRAHAQGEWEDAPEDVDHRRHIQAWYRDNNPGPVSNFTDATSVIFH
jgi:hypothetical protein